MPDEVVPYEETGQELVAQTSSNLFRTDDPVEIVSRATEIADVLSDVLKKKGLTNRISQKEYVRVEGWTLCGSMLGVFPVVEWTRELENGWEARVEARTLAGAVVGAAEAECLRSEKRWKDADDYSVRSMAQTRAISKALRAPLGFIVALAGYETTPEEEMVRAEAQREFDIERDLLPGAISGGDAPGRIASALRQIDPTVDWESVIGEIVTYVYDKQNWRDLSAKDGKDFWRRLSNTECNLRSKTNGDFPPPDAGAIAASFAYAFKGYVPEIVYQEKAPLSAEQAAEADAAGDDVPFDPPEE